MGTLADAFVEHTVERLGNLKRLAEGAMAQIDDAAFFALPAGGGSSIATNVQHIAGNMRSRWTDFLTSDGEKPWRHRDQEFVPPTEDRAGLMQRWNDAWALTLQVIGGLSAEDLEKATVIRGQSDIALQRVLRQLSHYSYHVGQIVYAARDAAGEAWTSLSVPLGASEAYNQGLGYTPEA